jgi:hypothetical protein
MNSLTILVAIGVLIWWYKPLRVYLVERTNLTVKVLLVIIPLFIVGRVAFRYFSGEEDGVDVVTLTVLGLIALWLALVGLGNWLEKRRPTKVKSPDLRMLSKLPGVPRVPAAVTSPEMQRAARAAADAAARVDWDNVASSVGRTSGRWAARLRKSMASDDRQ